MVGHEIRAAEEMVRLYDERLMLARHEMTGDWVIWLKPRANPFGDAPYPVIGLGPDLPAPAEIEQRLRRADAARRGDEILREINQANDEIQRENKRASDEATGIAAEALEWGYRKMDAHPSPRIFVPKGV